MSFVLCYCFPYYKTNNMMVRIEHSKTNDEIRFICINYEEIWHKHRIFQMVVLTAEQYVILPFLKSSFICIIIENIVGFYQLIGTEKFWILGLSSEYPVLTKYQTIKWYARRIITMNSRAFVEILLWPSYELNSTLLVSQLLYPSWNFQVTNRFWKN